MVYGKTIAKPILLEPLVLVFVSFFEAILLSSVLAAIFMEPPMTAVVILMAAPRAESSVFVLVLPMI